jgi:RNA polymerase sigma factor (sigma-70 family)
MKYQANLADEQLIQYFLCGDPSASATLVELYKDRIYASIYGIMQDKGKAEEVFNAVFIKIIDNMIAGKPVEEGKFLSWAMHIAHGLCIEYNRNLLQTPNISVNHHTGTMAIQKNTVPGVFANGNIYESHHKMRNMIEQLPPIQREVMVLNHYGGLSFREIAELMKCSLNSALENMRFGLRNLYALMMEKEVCC